MPSARTYEVDAGTEGRPGELRSAAGWVVSPSGSGAAHDPRPLGEGERDRGGGLLLLLGLAGGRGEPRDAGDGELVVLHRARLRRVVAADVVDVDGVAAGVDEESVLPVLDGPELQARQVPRLPAELAADVAPDHEHLARDDRVLRSGHVTGLLVEGRQRHAGGQGAGVGIDLGDGGGAGGRERVELVAEAVDRGDHLVARSVHLGPEVVDRGGVRADGVVGGAEVGRGRVGGGGGTAADEGDGEDEGGEQAHRGSMRGMWFCRRARPRWIRKGPGFSGGNIPRKKAGSFSTTNGPI